MKFKITAEKFQELLEKLLLKDMFASSIITTKEGKLISIQREEHGRGWRYAKFNKEYFISIDDSHESIEFDVIKTLDLVKKLPSTQKLLIETEGTKLSMKKLITDDKGNELGMKGNTMITYKEPEGKVFEELTFEIRNGIPHIGESKIPLDTVFNIELSELKDITNNFGAPLKTEFYKFMFEEKDGKKAVAVRIGDLHAFSDYDTEYPNSKIVSGEQYEGIFTFGIPQVAETFREKNITIKSRSNSPAWIQESTPSYELGVLIPPYVETA